jgi:hypothetical protein
MPKRAGQRGAGRCTRKPSQGLRSERPTPRANGDGLEHAREKRSRSSRKLREHRVETDDQMHLVQRPPASDRNLLWTAKVRNHPSQVGPSQTPLPSHPRPLNSTLHLAGGDERE